jgi:hypothetical protein
MAYRHRTGRLTSTRKLLSASWVAEVDTIERSMSVFEDAHPLASDCAVVFFEIATDEKLHVNVTHRYRTKAVRGWAGPGDTPQGFVHNRTFGAAATARIVHHVREMVFADPA